MVDRRLGFLSPHPHLNFASLPHPAPSHLLLHCCRISLNLSLHQGGDDHDQRKTSITAVLIFHLPLLPLRECILSVVTYPAPMLSFNHRVVSFKPSQRLGRNNLPTYSSLRALRFQQTSLPTTITIRPPPPETPLQRLLPLTTTFSVSRASKIDELHWRIAPRPRGLSGSLTRSDPVAPVECFS